MPDKFSQALNEICMMAESVAAPLGLDVVDVKFGQAGKRRTIEVTIYRKGGSISLDDCEHVSRGLDQVLDERATTGTPVVQGPYLLEVQSPGIDRQIKTDREFAVFVGQQVLVQTKEKIEDLGTRFIGTLSGIESGKLTLVNAKTASEGKKNKTPEAKKEHLVIDMQSLSQVRLHPPERGHSSTGDGEIHHI